MIIVFPVICRQHYCNVSYCTGTQATVWYCNTLVTEWAVCSMLLPTRPVTMCCAWHHFTLNNHVLFTCCLFYRVGWTALHYSAVYGHTAVAEQLIAAGAATDVTSDVSTCVSSDTDMLCCWPKLFSCNTIQLLYYRKVLTVDYTIHVDTCMRACMCLWNVCVPLWRRYEFLSCLYTKCLLAILVLCGTKACSQL